MDRKFKTEDDPTWIKIEKSSVDEKNKSSSGRPKSLDEIRDGVYFRQQRRAEEKMAAEQFEKEQKAEEQEENALYEQYLYEQYELAQRRANGEKDPAPAREQRRPAPGNGQSRFTSPQSGKDDVPDFKRKAEIQRKKSGPKSKIGRFFAGVLAFMKKHKVLTSIIIVILVIVISVTAVVNHLLNKINYVDKDDSEVFSTSAEEEIDLKHITLPSGEVIDVTNLVENEDGTYTLEDGRRFNIYGTVWNLDGSVVFYDGSYILADGTAVLASGTTFFTDGKIAYQNGTQYDNSNVSVDSEGYVSFQNGVICHLTAFTIDNDANCTAKDTKIKKLKHEAEGTWNVFDVKTVEVTTGSTDVDANADEVIEQNKEKFADADDSISDNLNDNEIWYSDNIWNILIMGIDESVGSTNFPYGRSDSMIVLSIDRTTKAVKMVSFSRAVYVAIQGHSNTRLNHAHGYGGPALAIDTIERNYKIRIDNYVETNFDSFQKIIDAMGGVPIELTSAEAKALKSKIVKNGLQYNGSGTYTLNGELALNYVRLRKIDTDRERTARQRKVLMAIANKVKSMSALQMYSLASQLLPYITTDMSKTEILAQLSTMTSYLNGNVTQSVVPHESSALHLEKTDEGDYEVLTVNWKTEVPYVHELFYKDQTVKYAQN